MSSTVQQLYDAHLTISGHQITWREIIGNGFGFASAIGGMRRRVWAWPVGIVGNVLLFTVFLGTALSGQGAPLYGQASRQVFFIVVSVYGWLRWRQNRRAAAHAGRAEAPAVVPRWARGGQRAGYVVAGLVAVAVCYLVFKAIGVGPYWHPAWWYYLADSWIFVGSMLATFAMARGWVDFWLCWIAVDLVGVPELIHFHYYPSAVLYGVYAALVIYGFVQWFGLAREEVARVQDGGVPRPDEVPA